MNKSYIYFLLLFLVTFNLFFLWTRWNSNRAKSIPICSNEERLEHLASTCQAPRSKLSDLSDDELQKAAKRLFINVDPVHKLALCLPAKAGCTTWKTILANNSALGPLPADFDGMSLHFPQIRASFGIQALKHLSGPEIRQVLDEYYKVLVVRHPFERLVSAFNDKLKSEPTTKIRKKLQSNIPRLMNQSSSQPVPSLSFQGFIQYISRFEASPEHRNSHWNTFEHICEPCRVAYDKIVKLESQEADSYEIITQKLESRGFETTGNRVGKGAQSAKTGGQVLKEYYGLSQTEMDFLLDEFGLDMKRFGYGWERKDSGDIIAKCENGSGKRKCC